MPGRLTSNVGTDAPYSPPSVSDYGDLVELTSSYHAATIHGFQTVLGLMSFSGGGQPAGGGGNSGGGLVGNGGGQGGHAPGGLVDSGSGVEPFTGSSSPGTGSQTSTQGAAGVHTVHSAATHTTGASVASGAKPKGKLPFTGFALVIETLLSMATISLGLFLRRFSRKRAESPADEAGPTATA